MTHYRQLEPPPLRRLDQMLMSVPSTLYTAFLSILKFLPTEDDLRGWVASGGRLGLRLRARPFVMNLTSFLSQSQRPEMA